MYCLGSTIARLKLKEIGGNSHKRWNMWFNSTLSEEPHQGLKSSCKLQKRSRLRGCWTGAARLSSARHVNGFLKWINERNPHRLLYVSDETAFVRKRKVGMTSSQRGPLMPWATHMLQWTLQWVANPRGGANPIKGVLSSDRRLQLASVKLESLVIADQNAAVNTFSNFALTARQLKGAGNTRRSILYVETR